MTTIDLAGPAALDVEATSAVRLDEVSKVVRVRSARRARARPGVAGGAAGEFVCLVGASGCGKSTLLNLVAGLDRPRRGRQRPGGETALMFQEAASFPG